MKSPGFLLWQVSNSWQRMQKEALEDVGLTHVQFALLAALCTVEKEEELVTQKGLARVAETDPMMTSQVVRSLEKKGFLIRSENEQDARALKLTTTAKGRVAVEKARAIVNRVDEAFFGSLTCDWAKQLEKLIHDKSV